MAGAPAADVVVLVVSVGVELDSAAVAAVAPVLVVSDVDGSGSFLSEAICDQNIRSIELVSTVSKSKTI